MPNREKTIGALDEKTTERIRSAYFADPKNTIIRHAFSRNPVVDTAYNSAAAAGTSLHFSVEVKTMSVCNQRSSGRC